jgi:hypothetical protein
MYDIEELHEGSRNVNNRGDMLLWKTSKEKEETLL